MSARSFAAGTPHRGSQSSQNYRSPRPPPSQENTMSLPTPTGRTSNAQGASSLFEPTSSSTPSTNIFNATSTPSRASSSGLFHNTLSRVWNRNEASSQLEPSGPAGSQQVSRSLESNGHGSDKAAGQPTRNGHVENDANKPKLNGGHRLGSRTPTTTFNTPQTRRSMGSSTLNGIHRDTRDPSIVENASVRLYEADRDAKSQELTYTTSNGVPIPHPYTVQRAGLTGPLLLQDFHLIDLLSHFDRERIPERVVHAKGSGAHGIWHCTDDLSDLCLANMFQKGAKCPITIRFSTVGGESGSPDLARDPRGFAVKFRTSEGNWDFVANNTPVFFLRDPAKFPHFIHTQKRDPATHLSGGDDSTMFWDYLSQNPESIHQVMILMGDRGIPAGWRHMHGYYGHTLKIVNDQGEWVYAQFHLISDQGIKTFTAEEASDLSADWGQKDLFEAIARGDHPSWTMKIQTMTQQQAEEVWERKRINVFDLTHIWPHADFPLRTVGKLTLNENPKNYFAEVEQAAFNPAHMVPGIEPSADPVLQSRLFSYPDAHRHRIGANYQQLPVNQPVTGFPTGNFQRDGQMAFYNQGSRPAYLSSIEPIKFKERSVDLNKVHGQFIGEAISYLSEIRPEDFNAPRTLWKNVWNESSRERFVQTVAGHMSTCKRKEIIARQIAIFRHVSPDLGARLEKATGIKGYESIEGMSFNGTHNGFGNKRPANGLRSEGEVTFNNGAPHRAR